MRVGGRNAIDATAAAQSTSVVRCGVDRHHIYHQYVIRAPRRDELVAHDLGVAAFARAVLVRELQHQQLGVHGLDLFSHFRARVEGADGSALYKRPVAPEEQMAERDETGELSLAERLGRQLEQQGWASSVAADGSMIYRMPAMQEAAPPAAAAASCGEAGSGKA